MRTILAPPLFAVFLFLPAACRTRSFSDAGYASSSNRLYAGELSEADVIGVQPGSADAAAIRTALQGFAAPRLRPGSAVMLVQSGAVFPDPELVAAFGGEVRITTFSGTPSARTAGNPREPTPVAAPTSYRLAAAQGGIDTIVCVWGVLESAAQGLGTKAVSWVPFIGWGITDTELHTRLRLRFLVVDVASGNWSAYMPEPTDDVASSAPFDRDLKDVPAAVGDEQAMRLKQRAIGPAVRAFLAAYLQK